MFYTKPRHREIKKPTQLEDDRAGFKSRNFGSRVSSYKVRGWQTQDTHAHVGGGGRGDHAA